MRSLITKGILVLLGLLLIGLVSRPGNTSVVNAGPLLNITGTPEEPPAPTQPPANTAAPEETAAPKPTSSQSKSGESKHKDKGKPNLLLVKTIDQKAASPGDLLGFSLHVTNEGDGTAQNVVVTDVLAGYLDVLDYSTTRGTVSASGRTITAQVGTVSPGEYIVIRVRAYLNAAASNEGTNSATVTSSNSDSDSSNNSSVVTFAVNQLAATSTPVPEIAPSAVPPSAPPATAVPPPPTKAPRPARLPVTGEGDSSTTSMLILLSVLGLSVIALGFYLRRRVKA